MRNGCTINIWDDKLLLDEWGRKDSSIRLETCALQKVKELMHKNIARWNEELLKQLFTEAEVQIIMRTPISIMGMTDIEFNQGWTILSQLRIQTG